MDAGRFARIKGLVLEALAMPPDARDAYLRSATDGDDQLLREARALLSHDGATRPGAVEAYSELVRGSAAAKMPETIGRYRILELLGEGGMGVVYRAVQTEPIRREVALKLTRQRIQDAGVIARFESERQTLALMEHPHIAKVLDAGADDGCPYFVMELVRGEAITEFCARHELGVRQRVELLVDVARAIRHAHRKGIIHRDLKPSNILVAESGGRPVPKVIDFSIAKALDDPMVGTAFRTRTGQLVGTLEYMSPEQARGDVAAIDVRTDVYSLGVIAYELLTGSLPHDIAGLPLHEAIQRIVERPAAPVRRSQTTGGRLHRDLETILHKCLASEPEDRYGSAGELVDDLERYLDARPILARPPSALYQLRTVLRRHRLAAGALGLVLALLVAFGVTVSLQASEQARQRRRAEAAATQSEAVVDFVRRWLAAADANEAGRDATIGEALEFVVPLVHQDLADQPLVAAAVFETMGIIYRDRRELDDAEAALTNSLQLRERHLPETHPDLGRSYLEMANLRFFQDRKAETVEWVGRAIAIFESQDPVDVEWLADALNTQGLAHRGLNELQAAERVMARSVALLETIADDHPLELANSQEGLAGVYRLMGRFDEAEPLMQAALAGKRAAARNEHDTGVSTALYNLGAIYERMGRYDEAERALRECLRMEQMVYEPDSPWVAVTVNKLASAVAGQERWEEADRLAAAALESFREGGDSYRRRAADTLIVISRIRLGQRNPDQAIATAREAIVLALASAGERHVTTARAYAALAAALAAADAFDEAAAAGREALAVYRSILPDGHPETAELASTVERLVRAGN